MVRKIISCIVCAALLVLSSCAPQQTFPPYPIITGATVSKTTDLLSIAAGGQDTILVTLAFTDGEGGIGPNQGNIDSLPLTPCTDHGFDSVIIADANYNVFWYTYHASNISTDSCIGYLQTSYVPDNPKVLSLQGTIQVYAPVECPPTGNVDTVYFSYFIKDRSGKISNRVRTPKIVITCQ
jgi:hypothetical protein